MVCRSLHHRARRLAVVVVAVILVYPKKLRPCYCGSKQVFVVPKPRFRVQFQKGKILGFDVPIDKRLPQESSCRKSNRLNCRNDSKEDGRYLKKADSVRCDKSKYPFKFMKDSEWQVPIQ